MSKYEVQGRQFLNKDKTQSGTLKWYFQDNGSEGYNCEIEIRGCGNTRVALDFDSYSYGSSRKAERRKKYKDHQFKINAIRQALDDIEAGMETHMGNL